MAAPPNLREILAERAGGIGSPYGGGPSAIGAEAGVRGDMNSGLREALAQAAAMRGAGRAVEREISHMDDAERFASAGAGPQAEQIAHEIMEMSRGDPGAVEAMVGQLREQDPQMAEQVIGILMGQASTQ